MGGKFWLKLIGTILAGGAVLFIVLMILSHALYKRGLWGGLAVFCLVLIGVAWFYDRRNQRRLDWDTEHPEERLPETPSDHLERF
ncbi:MAG TPA: hypothetical protein VGH79_01860 [Gaiellaceae bacterium]